LVATRFASFRDMARYEGQAVHFLKRAQILVSDLFGAYGGRGLGRFHDLSVLTAFADYKVPQVLRAEGLIVYDDALAATMDARGRDALRAVARGGGRPPGRASYAARRGPHARVRPARAAWRGREPARLRPRRAGRADDRRVAVRAGPAARVRGDRGTGRAP